MITFVRGNLLEDNAEVLVNTVNIVGVMGKGIALAFKNAFRYNFEVYAQACSVGQVVIGSMLIIEDFNSVYGKKTIVNFPTKTDRRKPSAYEYISWD
jgi:O-acetyl-ADP-ribose deacetylase (regulator of RNase III)